MARLKSLPIVQVDWLDAAAASAGWEPTPTVENEKPHLIHSWGALLRSTKTEIVIITDHDPRFGTVNGGTVIPRGMVKKIKRLGTWKAT